MLSTAGIHSFHTKLMLYPLLTKEDDSFDGEMEVEEGRKHTLTNAHSQIVPI